MDRTHIPRWARTLTLALMLAYVAVSHSGCATTAHANGSQHRKDRAKADRETSIPPKPETVYGMAKFLVAQGNEEQGERMLFSLILTHPQFTPAYSDLAELRMQRGRIDEAIRFLSSGLEISAHDPILLNNLGVCSLMKGEYEDALHSFRMAGAVSPYDERVGANTAAALALVGLLEESRAEYIKFMSEEDAEYNLEVLSEMRRNSDLIAPELFFEIMEADLEDPMKALRETKPADIGPVSGSDPVSGS